MPKDEPIIGSADTALRKMLEDARHKLPSPWNRSTETPPPRDGTEFLGSEDGVLHLWEIDDDKAPLPDFWMPIPPLPEKG